MTKLGPKHHVYAWLLLSIVPETTGLFSLQRLAASLRRLVTITSLLIGKGSVRSRTDDTTASILKETR